MGGGGGKLPASKTGVGGGVGRVERKETPAFKSLGLGLLIGVVSLFVSINTTNIGFGSQRVLHKHSVY